MERSGKKRRCPNKVKMLRKSPIKKIKIKKHKRFSKKKWNVPEKGEVQTK